MRDALLRLEDGDTQALERHLPLDGRVVFEDLEAAYGELRYRPLGKHRVVSASEDDAAKRLLDDFLNLAKASDDIIEAYARKHGVLGLCSHGLPAGHENLRTHLAWFIASHEPATPFERLTLQWHKGRAARIDAPCFPRIDDSRTIFAEPIGLWRVYALVASDLLESAATSHKQDRPAVAQTLDRWLSLAPLRPRCVLDKRGRLTLRLCAVHPLSALFGVLGAQVFFAASGSKSLFVCSECGRWYVPKQLPRTGAHSYCPKCGIKAAWRNASRGYYQRKKETN